MCQQVNTSCFLKSLRCFSDNTKTMRPKIWPSANHLRESLEGDWTNERDHQHQDRLPEELQTCWLRISWLTHLSLDVQGRYPSWVRYASEFIPIHLSAAMFVCLSPSSFSVTIHEPWALLLPPTLTPSLLLCWSCEVLPEASWTHPDRRSWSGRSRPAPGSLDLINRSDQ